MKIKLNRKMQAPLVFEGEKLITCGRSECGTYESLTVYKVASSDAIVTQAEGYNGYDFTIRHASSDTLRACAESWDYPWLAAYVETLANQFGWMEGDE